MGIFDKKTKGRKGEDFDSPIEQIDLSAATPKPETKEAAAEPATEAAAAAAPAKKKAPAEPARVEQDYGIEEAIALMRTLPADSVELVVRVVKQTLESTRIDIPTIIEDASGKQKRIDNRIAVLKEEITDLEKEIADRTEEISTLEADHKETSMVKERLELAEKLGKSEKAKAAPAPKDEARKSSTLPPPSGGMAKSTIVAKK